MKITICGSIAFIDQMIELKQELESHGHTVKIPSQHIKDKAGNQIASIEFYKLKKQAGDEPWIWQRVQENIDRHFRKIEWSDAILVANYTKNDIPGYIGGNTLIELGLAHYLKKHAYLLHPIPSLSYTEEIKAIQPIILNGDMSRIS